ncbi:MAG: YceH family protein [Bryobacteraceae bacterium]
MELLDPVEVRVLGTLIEKETTTPEYYPLSLNALVNASNQKSNRDPVVDYEQDTVEDAVERLREKKLALTIVGSGRVKKYAQRISETLNLGRRELAVLCTLLLRGPQTLGEIKDRSERMFAFADPAEAEGVLDKLAEWPEHPLIKKLPRQPGHKEARYAHLLSGEPRAEPPMEATAPAQPTRIAQLEQQLQELRSEFDILKRRFDELEAQLR